MNRIWQLWEEGVLLTRQLFALREENKKLKDKLLKSYIRNAHLSRERDEYQRMYEALRPRLEEKTYGLGIDAAKTEGYATEAGTRPPGGTRRRDQRTRTRKAPSANRIGIAIRNRQNRENAQKLNGKQGESLPAEGKGNVGLRSSRSDPVAAITAGE